MRKQKKSPLIQSLEELISDYDRSQLLTALQHLENDLSWKVFKAALMKEYLSTVAYALDNASKTGSQIEAAYQAGAAQTMYDTATSLITKYQDVLQNKVGAIETPRPEE